MEWKKLTEEGLLAARDYVPLMEKAAFAAECAGRCFDRMEVRVEGGTGASLLQGECGTAEPVSHGRLCKAVSGRGL